MKSVDVGKEFYHRLGNRDEHQGDGQYTAVDFRNRFLSELDDNKAWTRSGVFIVLDFKNVRKIGPSFANEAFGYFMKYTNPSSFLKKVQFKNISEVQLIIIKEELESGYRGR